MNNHDPYSGQTFPSFHMPLEHSDTLLSVLKLFPVPMEVFAKDGVSLFVNQAFSDFFRIDAEKIVGKFNILKDVYINATLGLTDYLQRIFAGEVLSLHDLKVPFEEIDSRFNNKRSKPIQQELYQDITCFPLRDENGSVTYIIALFMTKHIYQQRQDVVRAKEYMDSHWLDDFDMVEIAKANHMSRHYLAHLFKEIIGMTPYSYYQQIKIEKIMDALRDTQVSVSQAFSSCGADYSGGLVDAFKRNVGMTPTQYRSSLSSEPQCNTLKEPEQTERSEHSDIISKGCFHEKELFQIMELFPIPIQIFRPDGDIIFINEAVLKMWNVKDTSLILGKYNLLKDPLVNEKFGLCDQIRRTFQGETVLIPDIKVPLESFWEWYKMRRSVHDIEAIYTDILNFPVWGTDGEMAYVISIFLTSRVYQGRPDVVKAKEYLDNHWQEEYDAAKLAEVACLSPSHLTRLFKKHTGMGPYSYYQEVKINRLKSALRDKNLSVAEAFLSCGFVYPGNCVRFFKAKMGMTPSQYRKTVGK